MKQLDPKAIWLFFINYIFSFRGLALVLSAWSGILFTGLDVLKNEGEFSLGFNMVNFLMVMLLVCIISFVVAKLTYHYYRYEMSELVFKKEHGIVWKKYVSIPYDRIQNVDIYRGVFARLLGLSDIQIQTAGGITAGSYGAFSEGRLLGISKEEAERLRDELIQRARSSRTGQGL